MRIGSLFSGIGGLELGLEWAGVGHVVWQVERDPFARSVLARHWPDADRSVEDVTIAGAANLAPVDLICGGFPCQDISVAGRKAGLDGDRSVLWFEFARIVDECQPFAVVVENVAHGRAAWLPVVRRDLCELGYRTRAVQVAAADVGAPHLRERVFVIATADADGEPVRLEPERRPARRTRAVRGQGQAEPVVYGGARAASGASGWPALPDVRRVDDGLSRGLDRRRLTALGNAVVPQVAEVVGRVVLEMMNGRRTA